MSYRREPPISDEDIAAAVASHVQERQPPKPGVPFCGECLDRGCEWCRPASASTAELLGANIERLRLERGMTEAELAKAVGMPGLPYVAASNWRQYEAGERWPSGKPTPGREDGTDLVQRIARALEVPRSELLREPGGPDALALAVERAVHELRNALLPVQHAARESERESLCRAMAAVDMLAGALREVQP